jgi:hypothetical protein
MLLVYVIRPMLVLGCSESVISVFYRVRSHWKPMAAWSMTASVSQIFNIGPFPEVSASPPILDIAGELFLSA